MKKTLFDIQSEYTRALEELETYCQENQTDEVPDEINDRLVINQDEFSEKLEGYWLVLTQLKGDLETIKEHQKKIQAKKKALENNIARLNKYVGNALELYGEQNKSGNHFFKHPLFKVTATRSNKLSVVDTKLLPKKYLTEVVTIKPIAKDIKEALKSGEVIEGAFIDDSTINVTFR